MMPLAPLPAVEPVARNLKFWDEGPEITPKTHNLVRGLVSPMPTLPVLEIFTELAGAPSSTTKTRELPLGVYKLGKVNPKASKINPSTRSKTKTRLNVKKSLEFKILFNIASVLIKNQFPVLIRQTLAIEF